MMPRAMHRISPRLAVVAAGFVFTMDRMSDEDLRALLEEKEAEIADLRTSVGRNRLKLQAMENVAHYQELALADIRSQFRELKQETAAKIAGLEEELERLKR
jgi:hypothetical protein